MKFSVAQILPRLLLLPLLYAQTSSSSPHFWKTLIGETKYTHKHTQDMQNYILHIIILMTRDKLRIHHKFPVTQLNLKQ